MEDKLDVIQLTQHLVGFKTINPPGFESDICVFIEQLLRSAGFDVWVTNFGENRNNLIAVLKGRKPGAPLCFTGHVDTVPLGEQFWKHDPFAGLIEDGRLYGRGSCDMKGGVAAIITAVIEMRDEIKEGTGVVLLITGGEETGCDGARSLVESNEIPQEIGALVVAEPTSLRPLAGHRGALWLICKFNGVTAHGAMPHMGENAIYKAARAVTSIEEFQFDIDDHAIMGPPSINVGTIQGGLNMNSVPDFAQISIDIRTLPNQNHADILAKLRDRLGDEAELIPAVDLAGVWTDTKNDWLVNSCKITEDITECQTDLGAVSFFTDASVFTHHYNDVPTIILGPGKPELAHMVDEYCEIRELRQSVEIYKALILDWS